MNKLILILWPAVSLAGPMPPTPFPVFLKAGFSSVLEFDEVPIRVVLGDSQSFQVEKVDRSLVVRTLASYAASNMFVYFKNTETRLFILSASEDSNPTYYKKFENESLPKPIVNPVKSIDSRPSLGNKIEATTGFAVRVLRSDFDPKKDFLTLECELQSFSKEVLKPNWNSLRLTFQSKTITPHKLWAERKEVQKDSRVKFRLIFAKPNLPRDRKGVNIVIPLLGQSNSINVSIQRSVSK